MNFAKFARHFHIWNPLFIKGGRGGEKGGQFFEIYPKKGVQLFPMKGEGWENRGVVLKKGRI